MNTSFFNQPMHEGLSVLVAPTSEPVTLAEAKLWIRQESDFTADDSLISSLIVAARRFAEVRQKRTILTTTYKLILDQFPIVGLQRTYIGPTIILPLPRVQSVTSIVYTTQAGDTITLDPAKYNADIISQPARITPLYTNPWPVARPYIGSVAITYVAGYANAAAVPEDTKTAIKLLVNHWYRNREAVGNVGGPLALAVDTLLSVDSVGSYF